MKSLFHQEVHQEIVHRIEKIVPENQPEWGMMNAGQMFRHCQFPLQIALGRHTPKKANFLMKMVFKLFKKSLYNDKPFKKNLPTLKPFKILDERDFKKEKSNLLVLINDFYQTKEQEDRTPHPLFGYFTYDQWGKLQYKHLDHHLRQFGV